MKIFGDRHKQKIAFFVLVSVLAVCLLTFFKVLLSYFSTDKVSQVTLAKQYIAIAENIAEGLDRDTYAKVLAEKKDDGNSDSIKSYLEEYRKRIDALYVYTLLLDETDVAKTMVAASPPGIDDSLMLVPCTVPSEQVNQAKRGEVYYTNVIRDPSHGVYFSVGVPLYDSSGELMGAIGIDIDASDIESIGREAIDSNRIIFALDILFALVLLTVIFILRKWYRTRLKLDLRESEMTYISEMGKIMSSIKTSRHDLLNHLQVLNGLLRMRKYDRANEYLNQLSVESRTLDLSLRVKNPVLMVLLQSKWELANAKNIELQIETDPDEFDRVGSMDLVKLFANLLDNAIEAVESYEGEQPRRIRVVCRNVGSKYVFAVENPATLSPQAQKLLFRQGYTTKPNEHEARGHGMTIIRNTVDNYRGEIRFRYEEEKVEIQITI